MEQILAILESLLGSGSTGKAADELVVELQANESAIVGAFDAQAIKFGAVVKADVNAAIEANEKSIIEKTVAPYVQNVVDKLIDGAVASAPSEGKAIFDYVVGRVQAYAKAHGG